MKKFDEPHEKITINAPAADLDALQAIADERGVKLAQVVRDALAAHISAHNARVQSERRMLEFLNRNRGAKPTEELK